MCNDWGGVLDSMFLKAAQEQLLKGMGGGGEEGG